MSNNIDNFTHLLDALESIYIDNLQLNLKSLNPKIEFHEKDNFLNILISFQNDIKLNHISLEKRINSIVFEQFPHYKNHRVVISSPTLHNDTKKIKHSISNVDQIILTSSAKGGVGKSTTALNIAKALSSLGFKVGIVDADIYGPTIPKLLGLNKKPETKDGKMLPHFCDNIYSISIGYIVDESQAAIWRGPMVSRALYQLLIGVLWPNLDYLIIDMPPGTGDIYLSLAENFIINGAVLVTTPQNISQSILNKSISFFNKTNIPILGIVYNMSYFIDPNGVKHYIFGELNLNNNYQCLAEIPIIPKISQFSDSGKNLIQEAEFKYYIEIAEKLSK